MSKQLYDYYYTKITDFETIFIVLMSLGISFVVVVQFVLIPIIFQISTANTKVLSLFGMIHISEIKELASKCEMFSEVFLEEQKVGNLFKQNIKTENANSTQKIVKNEVEIDNERIEEEQIDLKM